MFNLFSFTQIHLIRDVFQQISGLAVQFFADRFQGGETDGAGFVGFEDREVCQGDVDGFGQFRELSLRSCPMAIGTFGMGSNGSCRFAQNSARRAGEPYEEQGGLTGCALFGDPSWADLEGGIQSLTGASTC